MVKWLLRENTRAQKLGERETDFANTSTEPEIDPGTMIPVLVTNMLEIWSIDNIQGMSI